ncbi:hypothetical protein N658DRAFT_39594 [Parathielavia hyrcaniae]|uniref:Uncharacterized protein n=1 Tax=Parathielavia hyrcaniae TaxID=113614 RepID=A0AAN6Q406_9PEZI|nr:hypothetical protein N658DRAFT_39594 [Parathielavia hyrcaniae]
MASRSPTASFTSTSTQLRDYESTESVDRLNPTDRVLGELQSLAQDFLKKIPKTKEAGCNAFSHWISRWRKRLRLNTNPAEPRCSPVHRCADCLRDLLGIIFLWTVYARHLRRTGSVRLRGSTTYLAAEDEKLGLMFTKATSRLGGAGASTASLEAGLNLVSQRAKLAAYLDGSGPDTIARQRRHLVKLYDELKQHLNSFMTAIQRGGFTPSMTNAFVNSTMTYEVKLLEIMMDEAPFSTST